VCELLHQAVYFIYQKAIINIKTSPAVCNSTHLFTADNRLVQRLQSSICPYRVHATARTSPIRN